MCKQTDRSVTDAAVQQFLQRGGSVVTVAKSKRGVKRSELKYRERGMDVPVERTDSFISERYQQRMEEVSRLKVVCGVQ